MASLMISLASFVLVKNSNLLPYTPPKYARIGEPLITLSRVDSTNNYAMAQVDAGMASHGMTIVAREQTMGKGQRGKQWQSSAGESLTMSIIIFPSDAYTSSLFKISAITALSCYELLKNLKICDLSIKWPNDLYWRDRKAGGILIESRFRATHPGVFVVGIGLNINQEYSPLPSAVSIREIINTKIPIDTMVADLCGIMDKNYLMGLSDEENSWLNQYNELLYKKGETVTLRTRSGTIETTIIGINRLGELITTQGIFFQGDIIWVRKDE